ncbi:helix-turn-helix domain-containing protein [uncultured Aquimarina sp.]|uniref:helix-turn-helix domain-containing protein n=1 Tax=uncultured Aquimarina sp. TaxID=575652 RepID=UPI00261746EE|nr:helix-turn-helix domain-containing protein [uncultured Aquimarina sp.]
MHRILYFLVLLLFGCVVCHSQQEKVRRFNLKELNNFKEKYYQNREIGTDSAIYYMDRLITSDVIAYKVFGFAAKEYLHIKDKRVYDTIFFAKNLKKYLAEAERNPTDYTTLAQVYITMGGSYKRKENYNLALEYYLKADDYAKKSGNIEVQIKTMGNIALIKQDVHQLEQALGQLKTMRSFLDKNKDLLSDEIYTKFSKKVLLDIGSVYSDLLKKDRSRSHHLVDSAFYYYKECFKQPNLNIKDLGELNFRMGIVYTRKLSYAEAIPYYEKSLELFHDVESSKLYEVYYNAGFNYYSLEKYELAKLFFHKTLSLNKGNNIDFIYVHSHEYLRDIYLFQQNLDSTMYYNNLATRFLDQATESKIQEIKSTNDQLKTNDTEIAIRALQEKNSKSTSIYQVIISLLVILSIVVFLLVIKNSREKKKAKNRLEQLLKVISENSSREKPEITLNNFKIKDDKHQEIIEKLIQLEQKKYFLKKEFNLYNTAKKIGTNTTYLSKIIKDYKQMNFSEYTNELRINHIVSVLKHDRKVRSYTTKAIGELGGYQNARSFTRIFKNYTGITPYGFVEKINSELENG